MKSSNVISDSFSESFYFENNFSMKSSYYNESVTAETQLQENIYFMKTNDNSTDDFINAECYNCNIKFVFNN